VSYAGVCLAQAPERKRQTAALLPSSAAVALPKQEQHGVLHTSTHGTTALHACEQTYQQCARSQGRVAQF
jgi:hypothetical protein